MSRNENEGELVRNVSKASLLGPAAEQMARVPLVNVERADDEMESLGARGGGVALRMPSTQAAKLTKAYNKLMEMKSAGSVEKVVLTQIETVERELELLKLKCKDVHPVNSEQAEFKDVWMQKYVVSKERFVSQLREKVLREKEDRIERESRSSVYSCRSQMSITSSIRHALAQAEEDQAKLLLKQKQLVEQQEFRRRQHERQQRALQEQEQQALLEQQECHELELQLEGVRARRKALSRVASEVGGSERGLPSMQQPTNAWLQRARQSAHSEDPTTRRHVESWPHRGGFVAATASSPRRDVQDQLLQHIVLAQAKLPTFKGEPLDFLWFVKAFEAQVASVTEDPERRLYLLLQQLQGQPYDLVKGCQLLPPAEGYNRAMSKLRERYGHPVRQAMAFRNKLLSWPSVRTTAELESFNVQLQLCHDVKLAGHGLAELDSPATLLQLATKLTNKLQLAWQTRAFDVENNQDREATYDDFVKFIQRQAGLRSHPVYSKLSGDGRSSDTKATKTAATLSQEETTTAVAATKEMGNKGGKRGERPGAAQANDQNGTMEAGQASPSHSSGEPPDAFRAPCLLCKGSHETSTCAEAANLTKKVVYGHLQGLCFGCLRPGHLARQCPNRAKCTKCDGRHPTILHRDIPPNKEIRNQAKNGTEKTLATRNEDDFAVSTVPIKVWQGQSEDAAAEAHAVLDPASTATFITAELAALLGLSPRKAEIGVTTMASNGRLAVGVVHQLKVSGVSSEKEFMVPTAYVVEKLPFQDALTENEVSRWPHLKDVAFEYRPSAPVAALIGLNVAGAIRPMQVVQGRSDEPYAVRTPLGWALQGPLKGRSRSSKVTTCWTKVDDIPAKIQALHYRDFEQAFEFRKKGLSQEDHEWKAIMEGSAQRVCTGANDAFQYVIDLPFRNGAPSRLADNQAQALQRLNALHRKFTGKPQFKTDYWAFMQKMIKAGYVEEVVDDTADGDQADARPVNYVPHHGVYHPRKPGKLRIVFNCASKFRGVALNDLLLPGPDMTNSLVGVLLRFRGWKVAFMADIESMFYRVQVPETQRDVLRFLWWKGEEDEQNGNPTTYRLKVHLFGAASSPSIANFALRRAAEEAKRSSEVGEDVEQAVKRNFYVDDCLKSMESESEATAMAQGLIKACAFSGFRLTKFIGTSRALLKSLPAEELAKDLDDVDLSEDKNDPLGALQERALGVMWHIKKDCFQFRVTSSKEARTRMTKRDVLSRLSAVYDPLGMAAPVIVIARILFRELTKDGLEWDQDLTNAQHRDRWLSWERELTDLEGMCVPRCLTAEGPMEWQLHIFCDASVEAYAAVAYLRQGSASTEAYVSFIIGKARVSPPKVVTVPRLELTAAKLAMELAEVIEGELSEIPMGARTFWTDSMTVLKYLRNRSKRFHVFVANRVCTILNSSAVQEWRHVPSKENPADEATRGLPAKALDGSMWLQGPSFLKRPEWEWPSDPETTINDDDPEIKKEERVAATNEEAGETLIKTVTLRNSSAYRVRYIVAIWLKFRTWLQNGRRVKPTRVTVQDLRQAELVIMKGLQFTAWPKETQQLEKGKQVNKCSALYKLNPTLREGTVVMTSRVRMALPIVPVSPFAERLVQEAHEQQGHQGRQATAAALLRRYWLIGLHKLVRKAVRQCPSCQRRHSRPTTTTMAPLPEHCWGSNPKCEWKPTITYATMFKLSNYVRPPRALCKCKGCEAYRDKRVVKSNVK